MGQNCSPRVGILHANETFRINDERRHTIHGHSVNVSCENKVRAIMLMSYNILRIDDEYYPGGEAVTIRMRSCDDIVV